MTTPGAGAVRDTTLGDYELLAKLATGGMAEIFLARKGGARAFSVEDVVVVKRILPHLADDEHFITMFRDEANLASLLIHPNVCRVHQLAYAGPVPFIVMEYLHGVALSRMLSRLSKQRQFLDVRAVSGLVAQACAGLHHAHEARGPDGQFLRVVHRDVSPPNILITAGGVVKLLDFGIAKARGASSKTRTGTVKGKNAYMSPEQILGKPLDRRSDVFALGAVMYELLAVKRLFHRDSDFLTFKAITEEVIPDIRDRRPDLPPALVSVLTRALSRDPASRFPNAAEMSAAVADAVSPLGGIATETELALIVRRDFADELATKDKVLAEAKKAAVIHADTGQMPTLAPGPASSLSMAATQVAPRTDAPERLSTEELEAVDGEMLIPEPATDPRIDRRRLPLPPGAAPSGARPPPVPNRKSAPAIPQLDLGGGAPLGLSPVPDGLGIQQLPDPTTDLLGWRRHRLRVAAVGAAIVAVAVVLLVIAAGGGSRAKPKSATAPPAADGGVARTIDAGAGSIDGGPSREDIIALSRYGFLTIGADNRTVIYVDGKRIGETPLERLPMTPGPYKVKAVGPRGKVRRFDIVVEATKDIDLGIIEWNGPE